MNHTMARMLVTVALVVAWPVLCVLAMLLVTGILANSIIGEWSK